MLYKMDSKEEQFRKRFRPGARVELISSPAAESHNLSKGSRGTIHSYDEHGSLVVCWDNGARSCLIPGVDQFKQLNIDAKIQEAEAARLANLANKSRQKTKDKQKTLSNEPEI